MCIYIYIFNHIYIHIPSDLTMFPTPTISQPCHAVSHCNTLQHTATHCNTLQHTLMMRFEVNIRAGKPLSYGTTDLFIYRWDRAPSTCLRVKIIKKSARYTIINGKMTVMLTLGIEGRLSLSPPQENHGKTNPK